MADTTGTIDTKALLKALPKESKGYIPFGELSRKLKLEQQEEAELREKLLALLHLGMAVLVYGRGWAKR